MDATERLLTEAKLQAKADSWFWDHFVPETFKELQKERGETVIVSATPGGKSFFERFWDGR